MTYKVLYSNEIVKGICRKVVLLLIFVLPFPLMAQHDVVTMGGEANDVRGSISFSVGQVAVDVEYNGNANISQGVQQVSCFPSSELAALQACDSLMWRGMRFPVSVDTVFEGHSQYGCDSTVHLVLSVHPSSSADLYTQAVDSFLWDDTILSKSGVFQHHLLNGDGCDSVVNLHLTLIHGKPLPSIMIFEDQMVMLNHYPDGEDGQRVDYDAYRWLRNGVIIPNANSDRYGVLEGNRYASLDGCFTLEVPTDATYTAFVQSNTICVNTLNIDVAPSRMFTLYPNPVIGGANCTLQLVGADFNTPVDIVIVNVFGVEVMRSRLIGEQLVFSAPLAAGLYSVILDAVNYPATVLKLVVK